MMDVVISLSGGIVVFALIFGSAGFFAFGGRINTDYNCELKNYLLIYV